MKTLLREIVSFKVVTFPARVLVLVLASLFLPGEAHSQIPEKVAKSQELHERIAALDHAFVGN